MGQAEAPIDVALPARRILERPRLLKQLEESNAQTILLLAPAGYGKTTLARQWRPSRQVWSLTAGQGSSDVAQLALELAASLEAVRPGLPEHMRGVLQGLTNPPKQQETLADAFVESLAAIDLRETIGFVDDYQLIAEAPTAELFFDSIRSRLQLRLLVASRVRPSWATARHEIYGDLVELGPDELALTDEESAELLVDSKTAPAAALISQARGWPAVLGLATVTGLATAPDNLASATLFRFFAEELFRAAGEPLRRDLATLALLPDLGGDLLLDALGPEYEQTVIAAIAGGFVTGSLRAPELHPLVREYLLTKLDDDNDVATRVRGAFDLSVRTERWDGAFALVRRFPRIDLLNDLIGVAFKPLVFSGRIATLEQMSQYAHSVGREQEVLVELIEAEVAMRDANFARAKTLAARVARRMDQEDSLRSHAHWVAGQAAQLTFDYSSALDSFQLALSHAQFDDDAREALWGVVLASLWAEMPNAGDAVARYKARSRESSLDFVRFVTASMSHRRFGAGLIETDEIDEALFLLPRVADPRARTSFLNACGYSRMLTADYVGASEMADRVAEDAEISHLLWVIPHADWIRAGAAMGLRKFAVANRCLLRVEHAAQSSNESHLIFNAAALRARLMLALQRPLDALDALSIDEDRAIHGAMKAEFLATKGLAFAVLEDAERALSLVEQAVTLSNSIEAVSLGHCVRAILNPSASAECFDYAAARSLWDPIVCAIRAQPRLLGALVEDESHAKKIAPVLARSADYDLARAYNIAMPPRPLAARGTALSTREREVLQLIQQGLTNQEIARTLFISNATVKVHIRHIFEKIGARSRTEAATWADLEA